MSSDFFSSRSEIPTAERRILFLTGTRADFGKMKPLMLAVDSAPGFICEVFATGMHMLKRYGLTVKEIRNAGIENIFTFINQDSTERGMDVTLRYAFPAAGLDAAALGTLLMLVVSTASQLRADLPGIIPGE